jgi:alpha-tubulin suppressor-like RCC1 family protein
MQFSDVPLKVKGLDDARDVVGNARGSGYCVLRRSGGVSCWGYNDTGELGNGSTKIASNVPVPVRGIHDATELISDLASFCALLRTGSAMCWGQNQAGNLGSGSLANYSRVPVFVKGVSDATELVAAQDTVCALLRTGSAVCWGDNSFDELGNGSIADISAVPVAVTGLRGAVSLSSDHEGFCAVLGNATVTCWGAVSVGPVIPPLLDPKVPTLVKGLHGVQQLIGNGSLAGTYCAILKGGTVECWGENAMGILGNGSDESLAVSPTLVAGLSGVTSLTAGYGNYCANVKNGDVKCWGENNNDALGSGQTIPSSNVPLKVPGLSAGVVSVASTGSGYCAILKNDKGVECWGNDFGGNLGNGSIGGSYNAEAVKGLT